MRQFKKLPMKIFSGICAFPLKYAFILPERTDRRVRINRSDQQSINLPRCPSEHTNPWRGKAPAWELKKHIFKDLNIRPETIKCVEENIGTLVGKGLF